MIKELSGNLLTAHAEALVNTVNTVGVAGKGIALQFRQAYSANFRAYQGAARQGKVVPGSMFVWSTGQIEHPHYIINFPTKRHWRERSRIEDIKAGLLDLVRVMQEHQIRSVAVPPLGCGNGGLDWDDVRPLIIDAMRNTDAGVLLYAPTGAPEADEMPIRTSRPAMTRGRAGILLLLKQYRESDAFRLSALEIQKLAYFLQEAGEQLRLRYEPARYGPYAQNLNHVLIAMEGHHIRGYGDRSREPRILLLEGADTTAEAFLRDGREDTLDRVRRVCRLVNGWETPYGLELLATAHWSLTHVDPPIASREAEYEYVAGWTKRKAQLFKPGQIDRAIARLLDSAFVQSAPE